MGALRVSSDLLITVPSFLAYYSVGISVAVHYLPATWARSRKKHKDMSLGFIRGDVIIISVIFIVMWPVRLLNRPAQLTANRIIRFIDSYDSTIADRHKRDTERAARIRQQHIKALEQRELTHQYDVFPGSMTRYERYDDEA